MTTVLQERRLTDQQRYRRKLDAIVRNLDRMSARQVRQALGVLADARRMVIEDLVRVPVEGSTWQPFYLRNLRAAIDHAAAELARQTGVRLDATMRGAFDQALTDGVEAARLLPGSPEIGTFGIARGPLTVAMQLTADLVQQVSHDFRVKAAREVTLAVAGGQTSSQAMTKVADLLRTQPARMKPGLGPIANQAERLVRTELLTAYNLAARQMETATAEAVPEIRKYWLSAHDARVRPAHAAAGHRYAPGSDPGPIPVGADFTVGGEKAAGPHDPRMSAAMRINCRCINGMWHPEWGQ